MMIDEKSKDSDNEKNKFGEKFKKDEAKNDTTKSGSIKSGVIKSKRALENIVNENIGYIKSTAPNVHCLTNVVTMQDVAACSRWKCDNGTGHKGNGGDNADYIGNAFKYGSAV